MRRYAGYVFRDILLDTKVKFYKILNKVVEFIAVYVLLQNAYGMDCALPCCDCASMVLSRVVPCLYGRCVSYRVVSVVSSHVIQCRTVSYSVVACRTVSYSVVACRTMSYSVVACRVVSCFVVPCRVKTQSAFSAASVKRRNRAVYHDVFTHTTHTKCALVVFHWSTSILFLVIRKTEVHLTCAYLPSTKSDRQRRLGFIRRLCSSHLYTSRQ